MTVSLGRAELVAQARRIGAEVAAPAAADVDAQARFPAETMLALREARLLGALVPLELGGSAATLSEAGEAIFAIGQHCTSSAMVLAMHDLQVACLVRHGPTDAIRSYLAEVASRQLLLASATSEQGVGGQMRSSICAVERLEGRFRLEKQASVISYGAYADGVLATARRTPDSPPSDQVLVLCTPPGLLLEQASEWDTLGMRGTCSPGFLLRAEGDLSRILPHPFGDIATETMQPVSHILWGYVWLGLASGALGRARKYVQAEARRQVGVTPPSAVRLAEAMVIYQQMDAFVRAAASRYDATSDGMAESGLGTSLAYNSLKVGASALVVDVVTRCLSICGIAGYREDSPYSLGRHLRDAYGAALMVNNDRILADNAQLLLVYKED